MIRRLTLVLAIFSTSIALAQTNPGPIGSGSDDHAVCATPDWMAFHAHQRISDTRVQALSELCDGRAPRQHSILSQQGHFRIHYDALGKDSVSSVDLDGNGVPDYADSTAYYLEYAWHVEIDEYGYEAPPPDNLNPGEGGEDGAINIYICNLPKEYYGGAVPEESNPIGSSRVAGFLVLDNDYKESTYSTHGIEAIRVTTAHEFHHIIQFASYRYAIDQRSIYEATAVWFERQVHPSIPDYLQYVTRFLQSPQKYPFSTHNVSDNVTGYAHELYMDYVAKKFNRDIVKKMWEEFRDRDCFDAMDAALRAYGSNLENSYCEFARWTYYTGYRSKDTTFFKEAPTYPAMRAGRIVPFADNMMIDTAMQPLAFYLFQVTFKRPENPNLRDTVDFLVTNAKPDIGPGGGSNAPSQPFSIELRSQPSADFTPLRVKHDTTADTIYYRLQASDTHFCLDAISGEINVTMGTRTSPQPFINDGGNFLLIAVGVAPEEVKTATVWIYSSSMAFVRKVDQPDGLKAFNNQLGVIWDGKDSYGDLAPSGVYIYQISINGGEPVLGKFAVVRK